MDFSIDNAVDMIPDIVLLSVLVPEIIRFSAPEPLENVPVNVIELPLVPLAWMVIGIGVTARSVNKKSVFKDTGFPEVPTKRIVELTVLLHWSQYTLEGNSVKSTFDV